MSNIINRKDSIKDSIIETNRYELDTGKALINRSANFRQQLSIIPKSRFNTSYNTSFFVRKQIAMRKLSLMMGFHSRLGKNSPFKNVLSKDVARWFIQKYITPETQCFVTTKPSKVWLAKELSSQDFDIIFTEVIKNNEIRFFYSHIITTELVMYPIVIQTPKVCLAGLVNVRNGIIYKVRGFFDTHAPKYIEQFTTIIDTIDIRCKEWIYQNSDIIGRNINDWKTIDQYFFPSRNIFLVNVDTYDLNVDYSTGLNIKYKNSDNIMLFDKEGCPSKKSKFEFFSRTRIWVKMIVVLNSFTISDSSVVFPSWKILQVRETNAPNIPVDYGFIDSD